MFPPKKQGLPSPGFGPGGPPDPFGGPPSGGPPDPFGGGPAPFEPPPGLPKPGQGMDPMMAMMHGLGPDPMSGGPLAPMGPPLGPGRLPVGGSLPTPDDGGDQDMGGSDLLKALAGSLGGNDPYSVPPMGPDKGFQGMGTGDPGMGIEQMLQMLALGQMGVGGGPGTGSSGIDPGSFDNMGMMIGM